MSAVLRCAAAVRQALRRAPVLAPGRRALAAAAGPPRDDPYEFPPSEETPFKWWSAVMLRPSLPLEPLNEVLFWGLRRYGMASFQRVAAPDFDEAQWCRSAADAVDALYKAGREGNREFVGNCLSDTFAYEVAKDDGNFNVTFGDVPTEYAGCELLSESVDAIDLAFDDEGDLRRVVLAAKIGVRMKHYVGDDNVVDAESMISSCFFFMSKVALAHPATHPSPLPTLDEPLEWVLVGSAPLVPIFPPEQEKKKAEGT